MNRHKRWLFLVPIAIGAIDMAVDSTIAFASTGDWHITTQFHEIDSVHSRPHGGVDYAVSQGTPIKSIMEGKVRIFDEGNVSFGKSVHVYDGQGHELIYGHMSKFAVHNGDTVHIGDVVGLSGSTGHSTGPHLHVEIRINGKAINPLPYIKDVARLGKA